MRFRRSAVLAVPVLAAGALLGISPPAAADPAPVTVTVDVRAGLETMPATGLGVNDAIWDANLGTTQTSDLLAAAGVKMLRYPGGSYGDIYHWETHTAPGGYVAPGTDFDTFMASARRVGAQPMLIANYGTGTPEEAAGWVRYANVTKDYGVRHWTVGNENYGNGLYGAAWEADHHPDKTAGAYARGVVAFSRAMKAVDPTIQVGAVLTSPGNWPDGLVGTGDTGTWNQTVLSVAGADIDFVDLHWYPGGTAAESLARTAHVDDLVQLAREQIARHAGRPLKISLTELNIDQGRTTQPGALFLADAYSDLLENGVFTVQWWNVHNGIDKVSTIGGQTDYGDFGLLSSGNCTADGSVCEPALNTPFAPYHGLSMMNRFVRPGDQFVRAGTDEPLVTAHAARRPDGDLAVLLINKDPAAARDVTLDYAGWTPAAGAPTVLTYGNGDAGITTATGGSATTRTLPPYSLTTLVLHPADRPGAVPAAPARPVVGTVTDRTAVVSWPAGAPGVKYEVYRHAAGVGEQAGETTGTSFTLRNLVPGTRYTVSVLARTAAGTASWSSAPVTFRTGTPAASSCAVRFADTNDWGNGFVGSIDVTNTGTRAIDGWTLAFTWPTAWQQVNSGWNATWTQTGGTVRVQAGDGNRTLAPGASTTVGFVAAYSGPNVTPAVFTLNGTVCTTLA
jgi:hypothetical protein